jgi:hypothetical protein
MWVYVGKRTSPLDHSGAARRVLARGPLARGVARRHQDRRRGLGDPPVPFASLSREIRDPALSRLIGGFAAAKRARLGAPAPGASPRGNR